jgi:pimeloyl-ACP methyl ester carboxylesterase
VRRLTVVSTAHTSDAWFPEVLDGMAQVGSAGFEMMRHSPMYAAYAAVAPDVDAFPTLMDRTGELLRRPYHWSEEIRTLTVPTLLVFADADSLSPAAAAEFFALLGGGAARRRLGRRRPPVVPAGDPARPHPLRRLPGARAGRRRDPVAGRGPCWG